LEKEVDSIVIDWGDSIETVQIQLTASRNNEIDNEIKKTRIRYKAEKKRLTITTTSKRIINSDGSQRIEIRYARDDNLDLVENQHLIELFRSRPDFWYWGTSTVTVGADRNSCGAVWVDENHPEYSGNAERCIILPQAPLQLEPRDREIVSRLERRQIAFREVLLSLCDQCAITGETTEAALDAAHIVGVAGDGSDTPENGILLRADIHRLYDARLFKISEKDGSIVKISGSLSPEYQEILKSAKVSPEIFSRIKKALEERARLNQRG
jgi:hypothetical protein